MLLFGFFFLLSDLSAAAAALVERSNAVTSSNLAQPVKRCNAEKPLPSISEKIVIGGRVVGPSLSALLESCIKSADADKRVLVMDVDALTILFDRRNIVFWPLSNIYISEFGVVSFPDEISSLPDETREDAERGYCTYLHHVYAFAKRLLAMVKAKQDVGANIVIDKSFIDFMSMLSLATPEGESRVTESIIGLALDALAASKA